MCKIIEELCDEIAQEAVKETSIKTKRDIALSMLKDGSLPYEKIAEYSGLPIEEIEALAKEL